LPLRSSLCRQVFVAHKQVFIAHKSLLPHSSRYTADRQATRRRILRLLAKIIFVSPRSVSPRYIEGDGPRQPDSPSKRQMASQSSRRGRFLFAAPSILALRPLSTCSSFRAKSSKMSATGHCACLPHEKGAAYRWLSGHCAGRDRDPRKHQAISKICRRIERFGRAIANFEIFGRQRDQFKLKASRRDDAPERRFPSWANAESGRA
jgi:hypothetical protein